MSTGAVSGIGRAADAGLAPKREIRRMKSFQDEDGRPPFGAPA